MSEMGWTFPLPSYSPKRAASPSIGPGDRLRLSPHPLSQAAVLSLKPLELTSRPWLFHPCLCWENLMKVEAISIPRTRGPLASSQGCEHHRKKRMSGDGSSKANPPLRTHSLTFKEGFSFDFARERYRVRGFLCRFQHYRHEKGLPAQMLNVF